MVEGPHRRLPLVYLNDILFEIEFLKTATLGLTFEQYRTSGEKRRAIERSFEIISEASRGISNPDKALHPDIRGAAFKILATQYVTPISDLNTSDSMQLCKAISRR